MTYVKWTLKGGESVNGLREKREALKLTQTDVAVAVGVSVMAYQMWERGASEPKPENLRKLKEVLGLED